MYACIIEARAIRHKSNSEETSAVLEVGQYRLAQQVNCPKHLRPWHTRPLQTQQHMRHAQLLLIVGNLPYTVLRIANDKTIPQKFIKR